MSYWTKRRKINESVAQQIAELSNTANTNDNIGITSHSAASDGRSSCLHVAFTQNTSFSLELDG